MTKAELIEALADYPDDAPVSVFCHDVGDHDCWSPITGARLDDNEIILLMDNDSDELAEAVARAWRFGE